MSSYSDWKHGAITDEQYESAMRREDQLSFEDIAPDQTDFIITWVDDRGIMHKEPVTWSRYFMMSKLHDWRKKNRDKAFLCIEMVKPHETAMRHPESGRERRGRE